MQVVVKDGSRAPYAVNLEAYGKDVISFGRHSGSDIVLYSQKASRVHGCFYKDKGVWYIKDLNSTNGIKCNNAKITEMAISAGYTFLISSSDGTDLVEFSVRQSSSVGNAPVNNSGSAHNTPPVNYGYAQNTPQQEEELQILREPKKVMGIVPKKYVEREKDDVLLKCPRCGNRDVQVIQETSTSGKDYSATSGCCGWIFFGPIGLLCGSCGKGKQMKTTSYWLCNKCGNKFKV